MNKDYVWVIAFDKHSGKRIEFTGCQGNNAEYYKSLYGSKGYEVRVITDEKAKSMKRLDNIAQLD